MLKNEITLEKAKELVKAWRIVYPVIWDNQIVKVFSYHSEAWDFCKSKGTPSLDIGYRLPRDWYHVHYNITHAKCPRWVKFELGYLDQLDLFLDMKGGLNE